MKSMTGFGRGEAASESGISFSIEISSVNRKHLDIRSSLPKEISGYETLIRKTLSTEISRGNISVRVNMSYDENSLLECVKINEKLAEKLVLKCREIKERNNLEANIELGNVLLVPGVVETVPADFESPDVSEAFVKALKAALSAMTAMRSEEGITLKQEILEMLNELQDILTRVEPLTKNLAETQKEKLLKTLETNGIETGVSDERILKELVIFADKCDVSEEITRLKSHFDQFLKYLNDGSKPVGRSMDFLIQEMNREITTLGNKCSEAEISHMVVEFKTGLEKIREQIQNIE